MGTFWSRATNSPPTPKNEKKKARGITAHPFIRAKKDQRDGGHVIGRVPASLEQALDGDDIAGPRQAREASAYEQPHDGDAADVHAGVHRRRFVAKSTRNW